MNKADRRDRDDEQEYEVYDSLYAAEEGRQRAEWIAEFGDCAQFPFKPNGAEIHRIVLLKMMQ